MPGTAIDLEDFTYELPGELIAQEPLPVRCCSRLLLIDRNKGQFAHKQFQDLPDLLAPGDVLVINDTKVIPARLRARRASGGMVDILLLACRGLSPNLWLAMASPLRKLKAGDVLTLEPDHGNSPSVRIHDIVLSDDGHKQVLIDLGRPENVHELLSCYGSAPLPPYIRRESDEHKRACDLERYQTIFARAPGAVAAPTAGLHFSQDVLSRLARNNIQFCSITLHVGPGTFKPITTSVARHSVAPETFCVPKQTAEAVNCALAEKRRIIAIGTTSCRAIETAGQSGRVQAVESGQTSLYIKPGYKFKILSGLITNFHLSRSSLLVLVSTFAGHDLLMRAYREAIRERYRFYSYGDAMLVV